MICETHDDACVPCGLVDRKGTKTLTGMYFAGLLHGLIETRVMVPLCPVHHATWAKFLSQWKREIEGMKGVQ